MPDVTGIITLMVIDGKGAYFQADCAKLLIVYEQTKKARENNKFF